ncbi:MAG: hypothetical protein EXS16_11915 [Gemmataceae bacterium]|nr:hypothetical protein [Gemmataceae bacterium]
MALDSIITEVRQARDELAKRFNYDLRAIIQDARERQAAGGRKVVTLPPGLSGILSAHHRRASCCSSRSQLFSVPIYEAPRASGASTRALGKACRDFFRWRPRCSQMYHRYSRIVPIGICSAGRLLWSSRAHCRRR